MRAGGKFLEKWAAHERHDATKSPRPSSCRVRYAPHLFQAAMGSERASESLVIGRRIALSPRDSAPAAAASPTENCAQFPVRATRLLVTQAPNSSSRDYCSGERFASITDAATVGLSARGRATSTLSPGGFWPTLIRCDNPRSTRPAAIPRKLLDTHNEERVGLRRIELATAIATIRFAHLLIR